MEVARKQVDSFGVDREEDTKVTSVRPSDGHFTVTTEDDDYDAEYVILATDAAQDLGCEFTNVDVVEMGVSIETSVDDVNATGAMVRAEEWQAVISAGDGATTALTILSKEKGEHFHDFDVPEDTHITAQ